MVRVFTLLKIFLRLDSRLETISNLLQLLLENQQGLQRIPLQGDWLDNQDVMQKLNISASTLKRRRQEGVLPCTRIKGKYFYKESDIQEALRKGYRY